MNKHAYQIVFLGCSNVGKTHLYQRMIDEYSNILKATVEANSKTITRVYNNEPVDIQLWDTAGQEKYNSITSFYLRQADGVFLVFDLTNISSLVNNIDYFVDLISKCPNDIPVLLIGNKMDLCPNPDQVVDNSTLQNIKNEIDFFSYIKTSAVQNNNVEAALQEMISQLVESSPLTTHITNTPDEIESKNSNCC